MLKRRIMSFLACLIGKMSKPLVTTEIAPRKMSSLWN